MNFRWVLYQHHNYKGNICVVMEGDRTNLVRGTPTDKDTKVHEFNDSLSSLKPLDFVRILFLQIFYK